MAGGQRSEDLRGCGGKETAQRGRGHVSRARTVSMEAGALSFVTTLVSVTLKSTRCGGRFLLCMLHTEARGNWALSVRCQIIWVVGKKNAQTGILWEAWQILIEVRN